VQRLGALLDHPIGLRSTPGKGSMFSIDIPLVHAAKHHGVAASAAAKPKRRQSGTKTAA
jgi:hypothetical protein